MNAAKVAPAGKFIALNAYVGKRRTKCLLTDEWIKKLWYTHKR